MYKRRDFLKTAAAGIAITAVSGKIAGCNSSSLFGSNTIKEFGLQLYSLRDVLPKDPKGVLRQVAGMGYTQIESFEEDKGIFWGMKNTEFKKYMDELGMKIVSAHCDIDKNFERVAGEAGEIGMKYLICSGIGEQKKLDEYKKAANKFNKLGAICRKEGLRFAYHNHDYDFKNLDGQLPLDLLLQNTDKELVDYQMDIYWVYTAGLDAVKWFEKYPNRFRLSHIKDRKKNAPLTETHVFSILGQGQIDFATILKAGVKNGLEYFIVEQDEPGNTTSLHAARENAAYLKKLKI